MIYHMTEFLPYQLRKSLVLFFVGTFDFVKKKIISLSISYLKMDLIYSTKSEHT